MPGVQGSNSSPNNSRDVTFHRSILHCIFIYYTAASAGVTRTLAQIEDRRARVCVCGSRRPRGSHDHCEPSPTELSLYVFPAPTPPPPPPSEPSSPPPLSSSILCTRPTMPPRSITLMPLGWYSCRPRDRSTVPAVSSPLLWCSFCITQTLAPGGSASRKQPLPWGGSRVDPAGGSGGGGGRGRRLLLPPLPRFPGGPFFP